MPLSDEGKHSKPSVYDNNRVVMWEGLYQAARATKFLFFFFFFFLQYYVTEVL